jgi:hypothetical protein
VPDRARRPQQLDRFQHVVQVVRRVAHAHERDLPDDAPGAGERHLRDDLRAPQLAREAVASCHAEHAPHRAARLGRDAHAVARQQHAFHRLAIGKLDQQPSGTVLARMFGAQARECLKLGQQRGQRGADPERKKILGTAVAAVLSQRLRPEPEHVFLVAGLGAERAQARSDVFDT